MPPVDDEAWHIRYFYGLRVLSRWSLPYVTPVVPWHGDVAFLDGNQRQFGPMFDEGRLLARTRTPWLLTATLASDVVFFRWAGQFEFLISKDGRTVVSRRLHSAPDDAFHACLLGPALSYALLRQGFEPLHATACVRDGSAIAFMGVSGRGKSTLAAGFLRGGHKLLTDDQLVLTPSGDRYVAHPGPPQLKLHPAIARDVLGLTAFAAPMAPTSTKHLYTMPTSDEGRLPPAIDAIYLLGPPTSARRVTIRRLSMRRACLAILKHTFNMRLTDPARLHRQFLLATDVAARIPIKLLSYSRELSALSEVRDAVVADVGRSSCS